MKGKCRRHDPEFNARIALEAFKGIKTSQQIAKDFDIHPVQVKRIKHPKRIPVLITHRTVQTYHPF